MDIWNRSFEQLIFLQDSALGFKAIIAIHSTKLGPALGGCRMWQYVHEEDAIQDALRLAQGMTYKSAIAGIPYGGGKAVIMSRPGQSRAAVFQALGRHMELLQGRYITGMDLGTTVADMDFIGSETSYVTDTSGSLGASGDLTAKMTAWGVFQAIKVSLLYVYGSEEMLNKTVAVQGLGKVGYQLCRYLKDAGAQLHVADINPLLVKQAVGELAAKPVDPRDMMSIPCDVFAPCALGGILNDQTIDRLKCHIVAGAANNQLEQSNHSDQLHKRGILYAPDYVINAGGIIVTAAELNREDAAAAQRNVEKIYDRLAQVYNMAASENISTGAAADRIVNELLSK